MVLRRVLWVHNYKIWLNGLIRSNGLERRQLVHNDKIRSNGFERSKLGTQYKNQVIRF